MAIPIQYIPEDRAAIAKAQIEAEIFRTNAAMMQSARENALKARLAQQSINSEENLKNTLFDKEALLRQRILNQELGARAAEAAAARRAEMEKFRMAKELQEQEPQNQLAREQLAAYRTLTPGERIHKLLGRDPLKEKQDAERFAFERYKFGEQKKASDQERTFQKSRWFAEEEAKRTFSSEDAEKFRLKVRENIAKNPLLSNIETQLSMFADVAASAPGIAPYEMYFGLAKDSLLKPGVSISEDAKKRQGQALVRLLETKKQQLARAEIGLEKFRIDPEFYSIKKFELEQEKASLARLESSTSEFLKQLYEKKSGWWGSLMKRAPEYIPVLYSPGFAAYQHFFGNKDKEE